MASTFSYTSNESWPATVEIVYIVSYNATTNQTTVTFAQSYHKYLGKLNHGTTADTTIRVRAADNTASTGTAKLHTEGNTNGGIKTFGATPSPTTIVVQHSNADGAKSITISGSTSFWVTPTASYNVQEYKAASGSATVQTGTYVGGGASTITSASKATLGGTSTVKWTPQNDTYSYELSYVNQNGTTVSKKLYPARKTEYSYALTLPMDLAYLSTKAPSGNLTLTLKTFNASGKQVGTANTRLVEYVIPNNDSTKPSKPTCNYAPDPGYFGGQYLQGMSSVRVTNMESTGKYGAGIARLFFRVESKDYTNGIKSAAITGYGEVKLYVIAEDTRGFQSAEQYYTINVFPYAVPKLFPAEGQQAVVAQRCDADGKASDTGAYVRIVAKASYSNVIVEGAQKNKLSVKFRLKSEGGSTWGGWQSLYTGTDSSVEINTEPLNVSLDPTHSYNFQIIAFDDVKGQADVTAVELYINSEKVYDHANGMMGSYYFGGLCQKNDTFCITDGKTFEANHAEIEYLKTKHLDADNYMFCNPNLLDNWYFGNPVNQRGKTSYTGTGYCIDRWKFTAPNGSMTVSDGCISLKKVSTTGNPPFVQPIENGDYLLGKKCTLSIMYKCNSPKNTWRVTVNDDSELRPDPCDKFTVISHTFTVQTPPSDWWTTESVCFGIQIFSRFDLDKSLEIKAVKLELGSNQTLARMENDEWVLNEIPSFAEQLARCQRFYQKFSPVYRANGFVTNTGTQYFIPIYPVVEMRETPSIDGTPSFKARKYSGGYSAASGSDYVSGNSRNLVDSSGKCITIRFIFNTAPGDTNNSLMGYEVQNLALTADL